MPSNEGDQRAGGIQQLLGSQLPGDLFPSLILEGQLSSLSLCSGPGHAESQSPLGMGRGTDPDLHATQVRIKPISAQMLLSGSTSSSGSGSWAPKQSPSPLLQRQYQPAETCMGGGVGKGHRTAEDSQVLPELDWCPRASLPLDRRQLFT